jgi:hypothetical protein
MPETLQDLATEVRSKNAGPFWVTMELFLRDRDLHAGQHHVPLAALVIR